MKAVGQRNRLTKTFVLHLARRTTGKPREHNGRDYGLHRARTHPLLATH